MSETWTVLRLLNWTAEHFKQRGSDSPRLDAEVLLAHAKGCERIQLYTAFDEIVSDEVRARFRELVKRRADGMPVAYLVGQREFFSLRFRVTPDVLIPRPETEFVVIAALDHLKQFGGNSAADIGAGSGAIAVAIARHAPQVQVTAIDNSRAALAIAAENARAHAVADRIEFIKSDLLAAIPPGPQFAVIASNPPYISQSEYDALPPTVKNFEPRSALLAGPQGTEVIERIIPQAAERLLPGGLLVVELSPMIAGQVIEMIERNGRFEPATIGKDLGGQARIAKAVRKRS